MAIAQHLRHSRAKRDRPSLVRLGAFTMPTAYRFPYPDGLKVIRYMAPSQSSRFTKTTACPKKEVHKIAVVRAMKGTAEGSDDGLNFSSGKGFNSLLRVGFNALNLSCPRVLIGYVIPRFSLVPTAFKHPQIFLCRPVAYTFQ
jgi:hypothetical protein